MKQDFLDVPPGMQPEEPFDDDVMFGCTRGIV